MMVGSGNPNSMTLTNQKLTQKMPRNDSFLTDIRKLNTLRLMRNKLDVDTANAMSFYLEETHPEREITETYITDEINHWSIQVTLDNGLTLKKIIHKGFPIVK
jgi:hypothetical protein